MGRRAFPVPAAEGSNHSDLSSLRAAYERARRAPRTETSAVVARLLSDLPVVDLTVEDPAIEEVIDQLFQEAKV